jgi:protein-tyrosine phosphatase
VRSGTGDAARTGRPNLQSIAMAISFVDIHCHLLPGIDDGAKDWEESLAMAQLAVDDGTTTVIATPHQLGNFCRNVGDEIRRRVAELQERLATAGIPLNVVAGADVRIEHGMIERIASGEVLTLGDHRRHVLLELPHELYLPLEPLIAQLSRHKIVGILSHPERNEGILRHPDVLVPLVDAGCLLQITAGSLCGSFGPACQQLAELLLDDGRVHFVASDGHGVGSRRPLMRRAYDRVAERIDEQTAADLCCHYPALVAAGQSVPPGRRQVPHRQRGWWRKKTVA